MKVCVLAVAAAALWASTDANAACPPLSVYEVTNVQVSNGTLGQAIDVLLDGTSWSAKVTDDANEVRVSFRDVSGPLDQVFDRMVGQAKTTAGASLSVLKDTSSCTINVSSRRNGNAATAVPVAAVPVATEARAVAAPVGLAKQDVLARGKPISSALTSYAKDKGWQIRWNIEEDFMVDVDIPLPRGYEVAQAITWVIETYQMSGALRGVEPIFHTNNVVSIQKMKPELK